MCVCVCVCVHRHMAAHPRAQRSSAWLVMHWVGPNTTPAKTFFSVRMRLAPVEPAAAAGRGTTASDEAQQVFVEEAPEVWVRIGAAALPADAGEQREQSISESGAEHPDEGRRTQDVCAESDWRVGIASEGSEARHGQMRRQGLGGHTVGQGWRRHEWERCHTG